jgi:hypothetical protein
LKSPLMYMISVVLGMPLALLVVLVAIGWYLDEIYVPTVPPPDRARIQHPNYHPAALRALDRLEALAPTEKAAILENIGNLVVPVAEWRRRFARSGYEIVCLGEDHDDYTRRFLADHFFSEVAVDALLLEATPEGLVRIMGRVDGGRSYVRLLDADVSAIVRTVRRRSPSAAITGIEETDRQRKDRRRRGAGSRDASIVANLRAAFRAGRKHVALFGALHCTDDPTWMFRLTRAAMPGVPAEKFLNVRVLGEHQDGPMEAFVYFLDEAGVETGDFVLAETGSLHPLVKAWFPLLASQTLDRYRTVVVFRP